MADYPYKRAIEDGLREAYAGLGVVDPKAVSDDAIRHTTEKIAKKIKDGGMIVVANPDLARQKDD